MSNRELLILKFFLKNKEKTITSMEVSKELKVSDRTIRNYIKMLQKILIKNGAEIIAKQGKGYTLNINNEFEFNTFLQKNSIN